MRSNARAEVLDLDLPALTPDEIAALERVRELNRMDPHEYLAFLLAFAPMHPPGREIIDGEPFSLTD